LHAAKDIYNRRKVGGTYKVGRLTFINIVLPLFVCLTVAQ